MNSDVDGLEIKESELLVATADGGDGMIDQQLVDVPQLIKSKLGMDVVFVPDFVDGQRSFKYVDPHPAFVGVEVGASDPLEETWCQHVVEGRLPEFIPRVADFPKCDLPPTRFEIGTYVSVPVMLDRGQVYGTLCCISQFPSTSAKHTDLSRLRYVANLIGMKMDQAHKKRLAILGPTTVSRCKADSKQKRGTA